MRLCYIANANNIHAQRWALPLIERGYRIHLLSYRSVQRPLMGVEELVDLTKIVNLRKVRFALWACWIRRYLRRIQPDILHAHGAQGAGWLAMMSNYHPFVVSGWGSDILLQPHRAPLRRWLVSLVLQRCDHLTVPSQLMYEATRKLGFPEERLHLVPWGVESEIFRPTPDDRMQTRQLLGLADHAPVLLCPRAVTKLYNHDILLKAVKANLPQYPDLRLVLLRYNVIHDYLAQLEQQIAEQDLGANVLWLPSQETLADMARLYRMSDAVVSIPSSEGYGFTVYEAMACGTPTVVSDLPVFSGALTDGVHTLKVPVRDAVQTSQALARILADDALRKTLIEKGLQVCPQESAQARIAQVEELYQQIVERHRK